MKKLSIAIVAALVSIVGFSMASPAEAVISPSPLNCSIVGGQCQNLSGVGQLLFSNVAGGIQVVYDAPDGFKIVGGDQFALNLVGVTGPVNISGTGIVAGGVNVPLGGGQVGGCANCFNFNTQNAPGGNVIDTNLPTGTVYTFTLLATGLSVASVVPGGPLGLDAELHLNTGGPSGQSVFAAEREIVPEPATLLLLGSGLIGLTGLARARRRRQMTK